MRNYRYRKNNPGILTVVATLITIFAVVAVGWLIGGLVFMLAWNLVVPSLFAGPTLDISRSIGILVLLYMVKWIVSPMTSKN